MRGCCSVSSPAAGPCRAESMASRVHVQPRSLDSGSPNPLSPILRLLISLAPAFRGAYAARIELSCKVVDAESKLRSTLCHEMCHAATWLLDRTSRPPHGPAWKAWAARAMAAYPGMDVTTCHSYDIFFAHRWQCLTTECVV